MPLRPQHTTGGLTKQKQWWCILVPRTRSSRTSGVRSEVAELFLKKTHCGSGTPTLSSQSLSRSPSLPPQMSKQRSADEQDLKDQALRLAERTMANIPSGETDLWASDGDV